MSVRSEMEVATTSVRTALETFSVHVGMVTYYHKMAPHALVLIFILRKVYSCLNNMSIKLIMKMRIYLF